MLFPRDRSTTAAMGLLTVSLALVGPAAGQEQPQWVSISDAVVAGARTPRPERRAASRFHTPSPRASGALYRVLPAGV